ncbi:MAG TPA: glycoside hydrolase family 28 protein [Opitutaceae bacterium]|nr:glycoside hydrolase family 28 protein [Opitutaceae bacterium]
MLKSLLSGLLALALGTASLAAASATGILNPLDYGAVGDGHTNNTAAFARVMAACAQAGGGTVRVPAGKYLTGSIQLVDNVTLNLEAGAELLYSPDPADSPLVPSRYEGTNVFEHAPLIYANGRKNIAITGRGTIDGQGQNWWWRSGSPRFAPPAGRDPAPARTAWRHLYERIEAGEKLTAADFTAAAEFLRPSLVQLYECHNVLVADVTITHGPMWLLHPIYSEDVVVRGVRFISAGGGPNGDGIDVDSCRNVRISDCFFRTSDDCIVIKSGKDNDGRRTNRPTEFVTITNCVMYEGHGAVVVGSETSGGIRNVTASNIVSEGTDTGIRIKSMRGRGGVLENFRFDNWVIEDPKKIGFEITMRYGRTNPEPVSARTPLFRNFAYSNITVVNAKKVATIQGLPERAVSDVRFDDINATGETGVIADHASGIEFHQVRVAVKTGSAFSFDTSEHLVFDDSAAQTADTASAAIALRDSTDAFVRGNRAAAGTGTFLQVAGNQSGKIVLVGNDLADASTDVALTDGAPPSAVTRK